MFQNQLRVKRYYGFKGNVASHSHLILMIFFLVDAFGVCFLMIFILSINISPIFISELVVQTTLITTTPTKTTVKPTTTSMTAEIKDYRNVFHKCD